MLHAHGKDQKEGNIKGEEKPKEGKTKRKLILRGVISKSRKSTVLK